LGKLVALTAPGSMTRSIVLLVWTYCIGPWLGGALALVGLLVGFREESLADTFPI